MLQEKYLKAQTPPRREKSGGAVLGMTAMQGDPWFDRPLPTVFHLRLASFLIAVGMFHRRVSRQ